MGKSDNQGVKEETLTQMAGGAETGSLVERTRGNAVPGGPGVPHPRADKPRGTNGSETAQPKVPVQEIKPQKPLAV